MLTQALQRLNKVILGGAHPYERRVPPFQSDGSNAEQFQRELGGRFGIDFDSLPAEYRRKLLAADCRALAAAQPDRESQEALLPAIDTPCLMYAGEQDGLYAQARKGAAAIANYRFITVPGTHVPAFRNAPAILPEALKFLG